MIIKLQKYILNIKNMIRRCNITEIISYFGEIVSNTSQTPEILLSSILLNRVSRKSETNKFLKP